MKINIEKFAILFVLLTLVFTPMFLNENSEVNAERNTQFTHGELTVTADDVEFVRSEDKITAQQIIDKSTPTAMYSYIDPAIDVNIMNESVDATYTISDQDMENINDVSGRYGKVKIVILAEYIYPCPICDVPPHMNAETEIEVSLVPKSLTITFDGNGGKVNGKKTTAVKVKTSGKDYVVVDSSKIPEKVERQGYSFKGWSTSDKSLDKFTKRTKIKENMTVYAWWEAEQVDEPVVNNNIEIEDEPTPQDTEEEPEKEKKETPTKTRHSLLLSSKDVATPKVVEPVQKVKTSDNITKAEFVSLVSDQDIPLAAIGNGNVPLYAPDGFSGWAFVNLVFAIMGVLMAVICVVISFAQNRQKQSKWFVVAIAAGVAGLAFFFMTQNLHLNMVLTDSQTIVNGILFLAATAGLIIYLRGKGKNDDLEEFIYNY